MNYKWTQYKQNAHTFFITFISILIQYYNGQLSSCNPWLFWRAVLENIRYNAHLQNQSKRVPNSSILATFLSCNILFLVVIVRSTFSWSCPREVLKILFSHFKKPRLFLECSMKSSSSSLFLYSISQRVFAQHNKLKCWIYKHVRRITGASSIQLSSGLICHLNLKPWTFSGSESRILKALMEVIMWDERAPVTE